MKEDSMLLPQKKKFQMKMITSLTFDTTTRPWWIEFKKSHLSMTIILSCKIIGLYNIFFRKILYDNNIKLQNNWTI